MGRGSEAYTVDILPKVKIELVVKDMDDEKVIEIVTRYAQAGHIGDM